MVSPLRDLVLRAARTNPTLQVIVFCFSREGRDGIRALLSDEQVKNGNILLVAPHSPEDGMKERKLTVDVLVDDYFAPLVTETSAAADHVIELKFNDSSGASHEG